MAVLDRAHSIGNLSLGFGDRDNLSGYSCLSQTFVWARSTASGERLFEMHITIGELLMLVFEVKSSRLVPVLAPKKHRAALTLTPREYGE